MNHINIRQADIFFCTAAVMLFTEIFSFLYLAEVSDRTRILFLTSLLDTAFLLSPYFILPPKWRRGIWILFLLLPVFTLTELLYFKHFGNFYYGNIILAGKITDNSVVSSALTTETGLYFLVPVLSASHCALYSSEKRDSDTEIFRQDKMYVVLPDFMYSSMRLFSDRPTILQIRST